MSVAHNKNLGNIGQGYGENTLGISYTHKFTLNHFSVMLGIPLCANYWEAYAPVRVGDDHWTYHKACAVKVKYLQLFGTIH